MAVASATDLARPSQNQEAAPTNISWPHVREEHNGKYHRPMQNEKFPIQNLEAVQSFMHM